MDEDVYHRMAEVQAEHWWYEGRRKILASLIGRLGLPKGAALLEAGCGPGANLPVLARFGRVSAFEPDAFAADYAQKTYGIEVSRGFLPHDIPLKGPFDMVGAFDVIEHVEPDLESLKALGALLGGGGHAIFTVPAHMFLWSAHDDVNQHKRRYAKTQFRRLLESAGYRVEFISYYNMFLFPLVVAVRYAKKMLRIRDVPDEAMPKWPFVNAALAGLFGAERFLLRFFPLPFGVSIVAVCAKKP
jgi:SAM-dependent methyltransferase